MKNILIFGAGNIGRSFIGQIFSRSGFEIVFIDVDDNLISLLNKEKGYTVIIKESEVPDEELHISPVRAINGRDQDLVISEIVKADYIATSIGKNALPKIFNLLAEGIEERKNPIDIIIAENLTEGANFFREGLFPFLKDKNSVNKIGLIETSIGKMVPITSKENIEENPLTVYAEAYNTLIVDKDGFITSFPDVPFIKGVSPIKAYVERKLYIHNLGHAATAYLGYDYNPNLTYIWEVLEDKTIYNKVENLMMESGKALRARYPKVFSKQDIKDHVSDLLHRFKNRNLKDTIHRVGRDLLRKLEPEDRLLGGYELIHSNSGNEIIIKEVIEKALIFKKADENGKMMQTDTNFHKSLDIISSLVSRHLLFMKD